MTLTNKEGGGQVGKRKIDESWVRCDECGSANVKHAGWRSMINLKPPPKRIKRRQYQCKDCLKTFAPIDPRMITR